MATWVEFWTESSGDALPGWWSKVRPTLRDWLAGQESVELCECDEAPSWKVNDDPTKGRPCRTCRGLRSSEQCILGRYEGHSDHPVRCRSTDERHIKTAEQWLRYDIRALTMANEMTALRDGWRPAPDDARPSQTGGTGEVERDDD